MKASKSINALEEQIEQMVRAHVAATRQAAAAAVTRAFAAAERQGVRTAAPTRRTSAKRRSSEELAQLGDRLCEEILATPGETLTVLAKRMDVCARSLSLVARRLRDDGRVRAVGQRNHTKYFPAAATAVRAA